MILDYQDFTRLIERYATELPGILASHYKTADLAPDMRRLLQVAETPFTLAVVGQMRAGKSSLLNALIGTDLAVVGVNETTATINWFKYGQGDKTQRFCVNWKDHPAEEFEPPEIRRWVGDSTDAATTNFLEFFADTPFLRIANIVDTPGTRSAIQDHADASRAELEGIAASVQSGQPLNFNPQQIDCYVVEIKNSKDDGKGVGWFLLGIFVVIAVIVVAAIYLVVKLAMK